MSKSKKVNGANMKLLHALNIHDTAMIDTVFNSAQLRKSVKITAIEPKESAKSDSIYLMRLINGPFALENISYLLKHYSHKIEQISKEDTMKKIITHACFFRKIEFLNYAFDQLGPIDTTPGSYWFNAIKGSMNGTARKDAIECFKLLDEKITLSSWVANKGSNDMSFNGILYSVILYNSQTIADYIASNIERIDALEIEPFLQKEIDKERKVEYDTAFISKFLATIATHRNRDLFEKSVPKSNFSISPNKI